MIESEDLGSIAVMESVGERIKHLRKAAGLTQEQLASVLWEETEVTRGAVGNWEHDKGISRDNLMAISRKFGVSLDWLANGAGGPPERVPTFPRSETEAHSETPPRSPMAIPSGRVPYAGKVRAGAFLEADDYFNQDPGDVPDYVPRHPAYPHLAQRAWHVEGDSMTLAGIADGMWAVAAPYLDYVDKVGELDNGNFVVVERALQGGSKLEVTVKEVQFARKGMRLVPRSTNPEHKEFFIPLDEGADNDVEQIRIVDVVLWAVQDVNPRSRK